MEKKAFIGPTIKAGMKFFSRSKGSPIGARIGGTLSAAATRAAKGAGYTGTMGGTIARGNRGKVLGLTGRGNAVGGLSVGYAISGSGNKDK